MVSRKIADGIRSQMKSIVKQGGVYPFLISLAGMFFAGVIAFCFAPIQTDELWFDLVMLLLLILSVSLVAPFLYGASICASDGTRYQGKKKYGISRLFGAYYKGNYGFYNVWTVFWKSFLTALATELLIGIVLGILFMTCYKQTYGHLSDLLNAYFSLKENESIAIGDYLTESDIRLVRTMSYFTNASVLFTVTIVAFRNLFRDDEVFFAANVLVGENKINMVTPPIRLFFRREILPSVRKEHFSLEITVFWPLYLASVLIYALFLFVFYFACRNSAFMMSVGPYIAILIAYVLSTPLYFFRKLFDALFYIAYSHVIEGRISERAKSVLEEGRRAIAPALAEAKKEEEGDSSGHHSDGDGSSSNGEGGTGNTNSDYTEDEDGTLDFTHESEQDENHKKDE